MRPERYPISMDQTFNPRTIIIDQITSLLKEIQLLSIVEKNHMIRAKSGDFCTYDEFCNHVKPDTLPEDLEKYQNKIQDKVSMILAIISTDTDKNPKTSIIFRELIELSKIAETKIPKPEAPDIKYKFKAYQSNLKDKLNQIFANISELEEKDKVVHKENKCKKCLYISGGIGALALVVPLLAVYKACWFYVFGDTLFTS